MKHKYFSVFLTNLYVFGSIVSQPLIHLVADAQHVVLDAQIGDHLELFSLVNLPLRDAQCALIQFILQSIHIGFLIPTVYLTNPFNSSAETLANTSRNNVF